MLKKILLTLIIFTGMSAFAADNYLNSVVVSKEDGVSSIILRTDETAKVKKEIESADRVVLTLKGVSQSPSLNTLYKNTSDVSGMIIQNEGNNDLKIYVGAPNISKANIVFETPNSAPITINDTINEGKLIWSLVSVLLLLTVMYSAKKMVENPPAKPDINELIKEREKALFRNFQKEVATLPSMNYKLKSYRKHVLHGETIRSYESRMASLGKF